MLSLRSRIWHAVQMEFLFLLLSAFIVFITYPFLSKADVPVSSVDWDMSSSIGSGTILAYSTTTTSSGWSMNYTYFTIDIAFAIYFIALLAFVGWWTFVAFVGVGISAIPMDLINDFRQRPIKTDPGEFGRRRARLLQHVQNLRKDGKHLENIKESVDKGKGIKGWRNRRFYNRDLHKFESRCMIAEKEFKTLENISKLSKLEPWLYYLQFILAIVLIIMTLVWIVHIFLWILVKPAGDPVHPFLNNMLEGIRKGKVEFLSTAMFVSLFLYLILATLKGNQKFGIRFAWLTYSSMRPNRTFINSFLLNMFLVHIWTMTILQYMMKNFSMFARNTDAFKIFQIQIKYAWFYSWFWNQEFFTWVLVVWSIIAFFYLIFKPNEQLELEDQLKNKDLESNRN